jgi:hypothetical protein
MLQESAIAKQLPIHFGVIPSVVVHSDARYTKSTYIAPYLPTPTVITLLTGTFYKFSKFRSSPCGLSIFLEFVYSPLVQSHHHIFR